MQALILRIGLYINISPERINYMIVLPHFSAMTVDEISFVSGEIITNLNQLYVWGTRLWMDPMDSFLKVQLVVL